MDKVFSYSKIFTVLLSVLYIIGLAAGFYKLEIVLSTFVFLFLSLTIFFSNFDPKKSIVLFLIFFLGIYRADNSYKINETLKDINADDVMIKGQIVSSKDISYKNKRIKFYLNTDKVTINNPSRPTNYNDLNTKILVSLDYSSDIEDKIIIGDSIELNGKLRYPKDATNPHQFNYKQFLLNNDCRNVFYGNYKTLKITDNPKFNIKNPKQSWYYALKSFELLRIKILEKHSKNLPPDRLKILGGLVFGNETVNPDEKIKEDFKNSGLLHLLAASGLNVTLIYGIWWWIATLIRFPYNMTILTGIAFVIFYTLMTGFPPSIIRAAIMIIFVLFGKLIDRNVNSVALIFFAGFLMLLFYPKMLFDVGFQLSFIVTLGLIICCPVIISKFEKSEKDFKEKHKNKPIPIKYILYLFSPIHIITAISVPIVAQLWVIPLQMHYFNNFAPMSVFANIAVVPFIGILSFVGFISSITALIPFIGDKFVFLFDILANPLLLFLIKISEFFASFKFSIISTIGLNFIQIFEFWIFILILTLNLKNNFQNKKHKILLLIIPVLFLLSFIKPDIYFNNLEVIMFDVENADSFLIKTPKNKYIMIDTGKKIFRSYTNAEIIMNKYFKNERINKLEDLIVTHFDIDHCGGVIDILKNIKVKNIILQKEEAKSEYSKEIIEYLKENNFNYKIVKNNEIIYSEPNLKILTFKPDIKEKINPKKIDNETSIITLVSYKDKNMLFMADAGIEGYKAIEQYLPEKTDIIKIGHHGAVDVVDNRMLKRLKPDYAIISSANNDYNHPHHSTLNLLYKNNVRTFASKDFGFVKIVFDDKLNFYHFNKFNRNVEKITEKSLSPTSNNEYIQNFIKKHTK